MNEYALKVLEFDKIIKLLADETMTHEGRELADNLLPYQEAHIIKDERNATTEAASLILSKGPLPIGGFCDIKRHLSLSAKGGSLTMKELLEVMRDLKIAADITSFMKSDEIPPLPIIRGMTDLIVTFPNLKDEIDRCIISEDEMADSASPALKNIRREIGKKNEEVRAKLSKMITSSENRTYLQDSIVTMRGGRYVIPVKQEHRQKVPGMIHDQSKGGQTLFVEPQAVVELNNALRELELAEQQEIARILAELSSRVGEHYDDLVNNQELIIRLDFIMAKGKLSSKMGGEPARISGYPDNGEGPVGNSINNSIYNWKDEQEGVLLLSEARHPLIDREKAVPINLTLGDDYTSLVITGPNTGGKTVSLKTAGLLSLMAMSGLHIPASAKSSIPIYDDIFADIGDEQSIEQSLSTFSSHMRNIVEILKAANSKSLVLLDELGAGTDPTEGAALAIAILDKLREHGASVLATTHYNELKKYALSTEGVSNASMEFNVDTLSPTYRLKMGIPGKSNAFEISKKLGLDSTIIDRASDLIERGDMEFEDVIGSLEEDRRHAEEDRIEAESLLAKARAKDEYLSEKEKDFLQKREDILNKAREEARDIIREAKEATKEVQKEIQKELKGLKKHGALGMYSGIEGRIAEGRGRLTKLEDRFAARTVKQINSDPVSADDIKPGDRVKVLTLNQNGEVLTKPDDRGDLTVLVGSMKIGVNIEDLMLINEGKDRKPAASAKAKVNVKTSKSMTVSASLNVQGENLQDALMDVEKYIDDVYMAGLEKVTIIHGRGEGILKNGIRDMLKRNKLVKSAKAGVYNEGGEGVTIVTMKK